MTKLNKKSGFSMLELVVVMLIMGTLAGIAISKMGGSDTGAIKASIKTDMRNAIATVNACYADTLDYKKCGGTVTVQPLTSGGTTDLVTTAYKITLSPGNEGTLTKGSASPRNELPEIKIWNTNLPDAKNRLVYNKDKTNIGDFVE